MSSSFLLDTYIKYRQPLVQWKAKSTTQLTSSYQFNGDASLNTNTSVRRLFKPLPLKIYRREIATQGSTCLGRPCNPRTSMSIDELAQPGGYIVSKEQPLLDMDGLASTLDLKVPNNTTELGTPSCNTKTNCVNPAANALRRVRSAGMIHLNYKNCGKASYYTNTNQYLKSRGESFAQNSFQYNCQTP